MQQRPTRQACEEHFRERNWECMASVMMLYRFDVNLDSKFNRFQTGMDFDLASRDDSMRIQYDSMIVANSE